MTPPVDTRNLIFNATTTKVMQTNLDCPIAGASCWLLMHRNPALIYPNPYMFRVQSTFGYRNIKLIYSIRTTNNMESPGESCRISYNINDSGDNDWITIADYNNPDGAILDRIYNLPATAFDNIGVGIKVSLENSGGNEGCKLRNWYLIGESFTYDPTTSPSMPPTTSHPTNLPTFTPSTYAPSSYPTMPSVNPSITPTEDPITIPTNDPTTSEVSSVYPTGSPTSEPTEDHPSVNTSITPKTTGSTISESSEMSTEHPTLISTIPTGILNVDTTSTTQSVNTTVNNPTMEYGQINSPIFHIWPVIAAVAIFVICLIAVVFISICIIYQRRKKSHINTVTKMISMSDMVQLENIESNSNGMDPKIDSIWHLQLTPDGEQEIQPDFNRMGTLGLDIGEEGDAEPDLNRGFSEELYEQQEDSIPPRGHKATSDTTGETNATPSNQSRDSVEYAGKSQSEPDLHVSKSVEDYPDTRGNHIHDLVMNVDQRHYDFMNDHVCKSDLDEEDDIMMDDLVVTVGQ